MGIFSNRNVSKHSGYSGGNYCPPGKYRVKILSCKQREKGFKGDSSIVEFEILDTNNPEVAVGTTYSWVQNYTSNAQVKLGNLADFLRSGFQAQAASAGEYLEAKDIEFSDEEAEAVFGAENDFAGMEMDLQVFNKPTVAGKDFHKHDWFAPADLIESVKAA